jgi:hypothetical protein
MLDLEPCVAEKDLLESVDLIIGDVDREFRPIEEIPERVMGLITKEYGNTSAGLSASGTRSDG